MAEVYAGRVTGVGGFQKLVAIKRMLPGLAEDDRFVAMFMDEGRLAAHISSPNVISTLDLGRADDHTLYLVMELGVGVSLRTLMRNVAIQNRRIPSPVAHAILSMAARGLHDAHQATTPTGEPLSIIHRDVSPHNILVDVHGRARITDFGIAYALQRATQTRSGDMKGKVAYFAPEQALGNDIDRRVDVFALGVVGWEIFAGRRLFHADNPLNILQNVVEARIPRLDEIQSQASGPLADAVQRALARDPNDRTSTAGQLADAVQKAAGENMASPEEVGAFVRHFGGRQLQRLQDGIRSALRSSQENVEDEEISLSDMEEATRVSRSNRGTLDISSGAGSGQKRRQRSTRPSGNARLSLMGTRSRESDLSHGSAPFSHNHEERGDTEVSHPPLQMDTVSEGGGTGETHGDHDGEGDEHTHTSILPRPMVLLGAGGAMILAAVTWWLLLGQPSVDDRSTPSLADPEQLAPSLPATAKPVPLVPARPEPQPDSAPETGASAPPVSTDGPEALPARPPKRTAVRKTRPKAPKRTPKRKATESKEQKTEPPTEPEPKPKRGGALFDGMSDFEEALKKRKGN